MKISLAVILALLAAFMFLLAAFGVGNDDFDITDLALAVTALSLAAHFAGDRRVG